MSSDRDPGTARGAAPGPARELLRRHVLPPVHDLEPGHAASPGTRRRGRDPGAGTPLVRSSRQGSVPSARDRAREEAGAGAPGRFARWLHASTAGRLWWVRVPLLPVLAWIAWRHAGDIWWGSIFAGINLAFHEIGHVLFSFFGSEFLTIAGGTILELATPVIAAALLARQKDAFGVGVAVFWWGTAFASVGRYVYDTRSQIGQRVSIGPATGPDDWTYLLGRFDLIRQDRAIGMAVKEVGVAVMVVGIAWCAYTLWRMAKAEGGGAQPGSAGFDEDTRLAEALGDAAAPHPRTGRRSGR